MNLLEAFNLIILILVREWPLTIMIIAIMILVYILNRIGPVEKFEVEE